ncbi:11319_t:CDS:2 [Paraglomus brasilianum]|uniref:11319_t:CDS:1 n=1 Tax=Paraglomus brasilianum TaxID=144538 RepID=A0A9N9BGA8_9GLOM|nr:11319_t:CDS:2 [Paraglomus brasilianum]
MEDVRLSSSSSKRIWVKYGDGQPVSLMFDRGIVDDLKKAIKKELSPRLDNVAVNEITLRRHGEGEDLRADLTVDENFVNNYDTPLQIIVNAPERKHELVLELASVMSGTFSDENQRANAFRCWLELFFDNEIEICPEEANVICHSSRTGKQRTDGSIYPKIGRDRVLLVNLEVKPEPGTNGDCYIQNSAYYKEFVIKSHKEKSEFYYKTCLPAFLINLDGPNLSISGAVCVPFIVCDHLTDIFPLDIVTYDHTKADDIARVLLALKNSMDILREHYTSVCEKAFYKSWIVEIQAKNMQKKGLVKYTQKYSKEAHNICFELGFAPKLWAINNLQQGWHIIFMEYLEEYQPLHTFRSEIFSQTENIVKNAVKSFHDSGYVHGDLCDENIMIKCEKGKIDIKFVDFDWAGREGEAKYPESLNPTINWHPDVGWHKLIKREHDHHLVDNIYLNTKSDKSSKKRRRLSEWMN